MSDITLSNAVRTNLSSLQGTADLLARTQERLSTGNKVNSALDNPVNFFTASGLTERSNDLSNLLDSVSNSVQTLKAADEGITAISSLVDSAKATARQALQAPKSFDSKANVTTAAFEGITADNLLANPVDTNAQLDGLNTVTNGATFTAALQEAVPAAEATAIIQTVADSGGGNDFSDLTTASTGSVSLNYTTQNNIEAFAAGDTLSFTYTDGSGTANTATFTFESGVDGSDGLRFDDVTSLTAAINAATGTTNAGVGDNVTASTDGTTLTIDINPGDPFGSVSQISYVDAGGTDGADQSGNGVTVSTAPGAGTAAVVDFDFDGQNSIEALTDGDTITVTYAAGGGAQTFTFDSTSPDTSDGVGGFNNITTLVAAINSDMSFGGAGITATNNGGDLRLTAGDNNQAITVAFADAGTTDGDDKSGLIGTAPTAGSVTGAQLTLQYGSQSVTYTQVASGDTNANNTFVDPAALVSRINEDFGSGTAVFNATSNQIELTGATGNTTDAFDIGFGAGVGTDLTSSTESAPTAAVAADVLTVNGNSYTYSTTANTADNEFSNITELNTLLGPQNIQATFDTTNGIQLTATDLSTTIEVGGSAATALFGTTTYAAASASGSNGLAGQTLSVGSDDASVSVTFGTGAGEVDTLEELNDVINAAGLDASINSDNQLVFETTNARGLDTLQLSASPAQENQVNISGTIIQTNGALDGQTVTAAVQNSGEASSRADLVKDYNEILQQITDLAADASYNGINLLNGDDLEVIFNENNTSSLEIEGVTFNAAGLNLSNIQDSDFLDSDSINDVLSTLDASTVTLRSQASKFGSNLSVVETRQNFTNELVNVLETGAANLTLADLNEEAANSAALSTRQQIATSALSLATQADQGILQLLR